MANRWCSWPCICWIIYIGVYHGFLINAKSVNSPELKTDNEPWLEDMEYEYADYVADSLGLPQRASVTLMCPPVPEPPLDDACSRQVCQSDEDCAGSEERCCYNGCTYTCMTEVKPPPFVDWIKEPKHRLNSGSSWLISGPDEEKEGKEEVEPCSTSEIDSDEDPLLCPEGFICHIEYPEDVASGIPNQGHCVKENSDGNKKTIDNTEKLTSCKLKKSILLDGASRLHRGKRCTCNKGKLTCSHHGK